jgi:uncharacterized RDD family membrane protein YckC
MFRPSKPDECHLETIPSDFRIKPIITIASAEGVSNMAKSKYSYELADVGTRLVALIIDNFVLILIGALLFSGGRGAGGIIGLLIGAAYHWYFLTRQDGQTPGKRIMKIRVVKVDGTPIDDATAIIRYLGYYISSAIFGLGWLLALFDENRQTLHDKVVSTYVVKAE